MELEVLIAQTNNKSKNITFLQGVSIALLCTFRARRVCPWHEI